MSKIFSALHKARREGKVDTAFNARMDALLLSDHNTAAPRVRTGERVQETRSRKVLAHSGILPNLQGESARLVASNDVNSPAAEQYRKLYAQILRADTARPLRTLLIASAMAEEGKTTATLNLAITIAASGDNHKVLLVETDFRRPCIGALLGIQPAYGFIDYLLGKVEYSGIFTQTAIDGLTVVTAGQPVDNPTVLCSSEKFRQFFEDVKAQEHYRYILLDSSPVLWTSEPSLMVQHVDAALLVVNARKTPREAVAQAIRILGTEKILGCIFNGVPSVSFYEQYSYYGPY